MTVVRITIKKVLTRISYPYRQSAEIPFGSEYLVQTSVSFPSQQLEDCARNIAQAESRLYPPYVRFKRATVFLATPGLSSGELHGQFSQYSLRDIWGQLDLGEDDALAYPPVVGVYVRGAVRGTGPTLTLPHVITGAEWSLYAQKRVLPLRFQNRSELDSRANFAFGHDLFEAIRPMNGQYVLQMKVGRVGDDEYQIREVDQLIFRGFRPSAVKLKKKPQKAASRRRGVGGEETAPALTPAKPKVPVAGVVYLVKSGPHFKIGKSIVFEKRLRYIKLQMPERVEEIHVIQAANPTEVETYWHRRFASLRLNGEWFRLSEAEINEFKSVSEM